ncbi:MAG: hypothetical protein O7G85_03400, partial [Planctomycetota bacterium]|nr:hypothetical protein [Planctomycetota bacterium]
MHQFPLQTSRIGLLIGILAMLGSLVVTTTTHAQGTSGAFPDPISTRELERYCDMLQMRDQQRQGIGLFHDKSLEDFRALRDGPIEEYLKEHGARTGFTLSTQVDEKQIEKSIRNRQELMDRIASQDNRLFDRTQDVLTDDQMTRLRRVRQARERARYSAGLSRMMMFNSPGAQVDLSEFIVDLKLPSSTFKIVDPIVEQYERNLTSELRELYKKASTIQLDLSRKMRALGFGQGGERPGGREGREQRLEAIQTAFSELNTNLRAISSDVSELNKRTTSQLAHLMDDTQARDLRLRYYDRAFPTLPTSKGEAGRRFRELEQMSELSDDQKQQIDSIETNFLRTIDGLIEQMVTLREKSPDNVFEIRFDSVEEDEPDENARKMENLRDQRTALIDRTVTDINLVLGQELSSRLDTRVAVGDVDGEGGELMEAVFVTAVSDSGGVGGGGAFLQSITIDSGALSLLTGDEAE